MKKLFYFRKLSGKMTVFSFIISFSLIIAIVYYTFFLQNQLFNERKVLFTQYTEKVAENVDSEINNLWNYTKNCEQVLHMSDISDEATLYSALDNMKALIQYNSIIMAFNQEGKYYDSDGNSGRLENDINSFGESGLTSQIGIVNLPRISTTDSYFLFIRELERNVSLSDDEKLVSIAIAIDIDLMQDLFTSKGLGANCHTFLLNKNGRRLYKNTKSIDFIDGYNIVTAVSENAQFVYGGNIEKFKTAFDEGKPTAFEIEFNDESWFVANAVIQSTQCNLMLFVPTNMISTDTALLLKGSLIFFAFVFLMFLILLITVNFSIRVNARNERKQAEIAQSANKAKTEFLSYMSHDIRTPINGIMGMTDIAGKNLDNPRKLSDCLAKINVSSNHLLCLVNNILDMSCIESGKVNSEYKPISIKNIIDECVTVVEGQLIEHKLNFICEFDEFEFPYLMGDELHLRQILINILGNAVKFTPDGGSIFFRVKEKIRNDENVILTFEIEDTGIGMSEEFLKHYIWNSFAQEKNNRILNYEGTGLGMPITKKFVEMLGGIITVHSKLDEGSKFTVEIPFDIDKNLSNKYEEEKIELSLEGITVLLAEDTELNREIVEELLSEEGINVVSVENGKLAYEAFLESEIGAFDAIIMDVMMPVMDGYDATRAIRNSEREDAKTVPIIAMTANAFDEDIKRALDSGMNIHLSKPFNIGVLLDLLAKTILNNKNGEKL